MSEEIETNNPSTVTEQPTGTQDTVASGTGGQTTPEQPKETTEEAFFDPNGLSPELQQAYKQMQGAFTKKMQETADWKKKGESLDQLVQYEPFVKWYNQHKAGLDEVPETEQSKERTQPKESEPELTPEEHALLVQDPKRFNEYVKSLAQKVAEPIANEARMKAEYVSNLNQVESFGREHPDLYELDRMGLLQPLMKKYPGMELEDYYKLAKYPFLQEEAIKKAHNVVNDKKNAVTEKPGAVLPGSSRVKVKNREEAMALAWEAASSGRDVPDFDFSK